jgi:MoxR-like ATPase
VSQLAPEPPLGDLVIEPVLHAAALRDLVRQEVSKAVIGHEQAIDLLAVAAIAGGHVLIEGPPGVAKTLLVNALAHTLGLSFNRIQFTPDTQPRHVTGETVERMGENVFMQGPVFANMLLADEINRTPPRTQAALLEAMQERQVTVDGKTHFLPSPFLVVATQNPYERADEIFQLPESQLDRFLFKVEMRYGDAEQELAMLQLPHAGLAPDLIGEVQPALDRSGLMHAQREVDETEVPEEMARYVVAVVRKTRELPGVALGASPRATLHLLTAAKANARLAGRAVADHSDVSAMAPFVLGHRIIVSAGSPLGAVEEALAEAYV